MRHLKRHLTKSDDLDVHMAFAPLPLKESNGGTTPLQLPRAVATPARPCKARRSPDRTLVGRVSWSDIAQTSQESLTAPDASPCTPTGAFRIRTPNSPPSTQHWRHRAAPGADLEMTDINEGRLRQEFCEVEEIGRGQFSTVYKAKNCVDQCHYAVKKTTRISKGLRQTELREVFALANVSMEAAACPYIVRYYSSWLEDGRLHIQTELCRCSLRDRLNERKAWPVASFTENEILEVLRHVAAGLQVLHSLGFVHLDIKPDNILVARSDEGCYKIADLGLAAAAMGTGCDDITEGDCRYLAKEVLRGDLRDLPKADIFSLGLVLYELAINPRGLPSNGPEWQMIRERLEDMQLLLQEMACANKELRPTCEALLQRVGNSTPEMKVTRFSSAAGTGIRRQNEALEEENRRCREEAARNKQRADSYWQEIVQMKKQELLTTSGAVPVPMREDESKVQLRRSHTSH